MNLVVGATGQLGTAVVRALTAAGRPVRAFVRPGSAARAVPGPKLALGDLRVPADVDRACRGVEAVICTAKSILPAPGDRAGEAEHGGYGNLLEACRRHGVKQFLFISAPMSPLDEKVPPIRWKRWNEGRIRESGNSYTIFRAPPFMDSWLAVIGSRLPLRGSENPTLGRPLLVLSSVLARRGQPDEAQAMGARAGPGTTCDVLSRRPGRRLSGKRDRPSFRPRRDFRHRRTGGALLDGRRRDLLPDPWPAIRAFAVPPAVYRAQQLLWKPFSAAASNQMGLNWLLASCDSVVDMRETAPLFGVNLTSVETFLREKARLEERERSVLA